MTTIGHSSCLVLNVIPARVVVEERLDRWSAPSATWTQLPAT
jgi:hypothetical protein